MDFASEERLTVVDHPLIKHKLSVIRNEDTPDYLFPPDRARDYSFGRLRSHPGPGNALGRGENAYCHV
mgnify:CR=1 FL=1